VRRENDGFVSKDGAPNQRKQGYATGLRKWRGTRDEVLEKWCLLTLRYIAWTSE
jgi:hypothetical protein